MPKPLKDYTGRCGSCSHFSFYVIDGVLRYRGNCDCANTRYYMHNNRRGCRYMAQHSSYRQASQKACKKYKLNESFKEGANGMNAYEIAEVIAEYLVDNKDLTIAMIKDNDMETLQDEIYAELTEK